MARYRTIKPEFWTSEQVADCSPTARLLFIGMWNFCDDYGNHPASEKTLKMEVFPGDEFNVETMKALIGELINSELIVPYVGEDGRQYWHVTGWHHQKIEKPNRKHPAYIRQPFADDSPNDTRPIDDSSPPEGKGRERNGRESTEKTTRAVPQPGQDKPATASRFDPQAFLIDRGVTEPVCRDWLALRKQKRAPVTETAINGIVREAQSAGMSLDAVLALCCQRGWQGFKAEWVQDKHGAGGQKTVGQERAEVAAVLAGSQQPPPVEPQTQGTLIEGEARHVA